MSKRKSDGVYQGVYSDHLNGGKVGATANNRARNRLMLTERMYMRVLTELSVNRFKWTGLPDTVDERFLEMTLFHRALSVFYWDTQHHRYMALRASGAGRVNMYDNPTTFTVTGGIMVNKNLKARECVPIWANYMRQPDLDIVMLYATKLADIDRTIEINSQQMRFSSVLTVPENERLSWQNLMRQRDEGNPLLFGSNNLDMSNVQAFDIGVDPKTLPELLLARSKMWADCMTLLGIDNANTDKKERLVADEVDANAEQISAAKAINLNARQQAAEQINRMYPGQNVGVGFRMDMERPEMSNYAMGLLGDGMDDDDPVEESGDKPELEGGK